jgi:hypothetical protein
MIDRQCRLKPRSLSSRKPYHSSVVIVAWAGRVESECFSESIRQVCVAQLAAKEVTEASRAKTSSANLHVFFALGRQPRGSGMILAVRGHMSFQWITDIPAAQS